MKNSSTTNEVTELKAIVESLQSRVTTLEKKVRTLENKVEALESTLLVSQNTSDKLSEELDKQSAEFDRLHQYSRRNCIIVSGIPVKKNETCEDLKRSFEKTLSKIWEKTQKKNLILNATSPQARNSKWY